MKIILENVRKKYGDQFETEALNMEIDSGDFVSFLGPSGCGKTTVLRMIAGLEKPDSGEIRFDDTCVYSDKKNINTAPENRNLGFVFQNFALWPHMNIFENVAFPLRAKKKLKI